MSKEHVDMNEVMQAILNGHSEDLLSELLQEKQEVQKLQADNHWLQSKVDRLTSIIDNDPSLDGYQDQAIQTSMYVAVDHPATKSFLEIFEALGKIAERSKKVFRDRNGKFDQDSQDRMFAAFDLIAAKKDIIVASLDVQAQSSEKLMVDDVVYPVFGLMGESGELAGKVLHWVENPDDEQGLNDLLLECGDVLWYLSAIVTFLGFPLSKIAKMNIKKLRDRQARQMIQGEGDNR